MGYLKIQQYNDQKDTLTQTKTQLDTSRKETVEAKHETDVANQAKDAATTQLGEVQSKLTDLNTQLASAQKDKDDLTAAVATQKAATDKVQAQLDHINTIFGGMSPEDVKAASDKLTQQVAADLAEQKILQDQLQASVQQVSDLQDAINRSKTGTMPPGISGKVTFVNRTWNFVVLNVGLSNGIVPNGELIIYHGRDFLGKVKVTSAEANSSVADILPDAKADIQVGDDVIN